jgi:hypothetical protein
MPNLTRRNTFAIAAGAALAASTGAASAFPAPSHLPGLIAGFGKAKAAFEKAFKIHTRKDERRLVAISRIPADVRYFSAHELDAYRPQGLAVSATFDLCKTTLPGAIAEVESQAARLRFWKFSPALDPATAANQIAAILAAPAADSEIDSAALEAIQRLKASKAKVAAILAALGCEAEQQAQNSACDALDAVRRKIIAYRPANEAETLAKGQWLADVFASGRDGLSDTEAAMLLSTLYPLPA